MEGGTAHQLPIVVTAAAVVN